MSSLFRLMCRWSVEEGNVFAWSYGLLQWNLMARSSNIDALCFHNVKRGVSDSLTFKFDSSKSDQTGEFVTEKKVYANPLNPEIHMSLDYTCCAYKLDYE